MGTAQDMQPHIIVKEAEEDNALEFKKTPHQVTTSQPGDFIRWVRITIYTLFILSGQSAAILLGRLYYDKGGKIIWMATLVQFTGFPILIPYHCILSSKKIAAHSNVHQPSASVLTAMNLSLGVLLAADSLLYSMGLLYLPVSTFSLICASQLAFNAFFSFCLNSQKFTPFIVNSLVLLTISSTLLVFHPNSANPTGVSKERYTIGVICTVGASAGYGLMFSLTQFSFEKVLKAKTFVTVLEMIIYESLIATCATLVGLFVTGEWKGLKSEMEEFALGRLSYFLTLICTATACPTFNIGAIGLIFEVSSLVSNVISASGLPFIPVLAVIFFNDNMDGIKVIATLLALWGFASYLYQHYLDDSESKSETKHVEEISMIPLLKEVNC
ncbi:hypothetical protein COP2_037566 [Malus domestica]